MVNEIKNKDEVRNNWLDGNEPEKIRCPICYETNNLTPNGICKSCISEINKNKVIERFYGGF